MFAPSGMPVKNNCAVDFPEVLDLDPYCTDGALSAHPTQPISSPRPGPIQHRYSLSALVVHFGAHSYGHFVTFRKHRPSGTWFRTSDESVYQTSLESVLGSNPFLLFYELQKPPARIELQDPPKTKPSGDSIRECVVQRAACEQREKIHVQS